MATSLRSLARWSMGWFELPPGTIIDLTRICSIAEEIHASDQPLKAIAAGHGFDSPSSMGRLFLRYSGTTPALYRRGYRLGRPAESAQTGMKNEG